MNMSESSISAELKNSLKNKKMMMTEPESPVEEEFSSPIKLICIGDSAVGKSKLLERFLKDDFKSRQNSTFALALYKHKATIGNKKVPVDIWDTAGQERFMSLHSSYYHQADACVLVFDATRKSTYKNLSTWYKELRHYRPQIPCFLAANKIDSNKEITTKTFAFSERNGIPLYFVSAATGSNVVKLFSDAINGAFEYKKNPTDWKDQILLELEKICSSNDSKSSHQQLSANPNSSTKPNATKTIASM